MFRKRPAAEAGSNSSSFDDLVSSLRLRISRLKRIRSPPNESTASFRKFGSVKVSVPITTLEVPVAKSARASAKLVMPASTIVASPVLASCSGNDREGWPPMIASKSATYSSRKPRERKVNATSRGFELPHRILLTGLYRSLSPRTACTTTPFKTSMTGITLKAAPKRRLAVSWRGL